MEIPRHWRLKAQRYRLEGSACPTCGQVSFPPRPSCQYCSVQPVQLVERGNHLLPGWSQRDEVYAELSPDTPALQRGYTAKIDAQISHPSLIKIG
jgi:hypothetical protein